MSLHITAETTDDQIMAPVTRAKEALAKSARDAVDYGYMVGEDLVSLAQNIFSAEQLACAQMPYRDVCANAPHNRVFYLADLAARGADDRWSGRKNDSNRSAYDAVIGWVRDEIAVLKRETR